MRKSVLAALLPITLTAGLVSVSGQSPATAAGDRWSGNVEISTATTRDAAGLKIDASTAGGFVAAWASVAADDIVAVNRPTGGSFGAPQVFTGSYAEPEVAIGGNNVAVLAWDDSVGRTTVYASSKTSGGSLFSSPATFVGDGHTTPAAAASAQDPTVAVNHDGVGMLFFERDIYNPPSYTDIAEAIEGRTLLDPTSNTWNSGTDVHGDIKDPRGKEISIGPDGSAFMATNNFSQGPCWDLGVMVMNANGTGSGGDDIAVDCAGAKYRGIHPSNTRMPDNSILMALQHYNDNGVYTVSFDKARAAAGDSNLEGAEVRLDAGDGSQSGGSVLVRSDAAGNAIVVWYDSSPSGPSAKSILARMRPAGSSVWGPVEVVSTGEDYTGELDFDMDRAGNAFLVYGRSKPASLDDEIVAVERTPGSSGAWNTPELLSENLGAVSSPRIAAGRNGEAFAAWVATGSDAVYAAVLAPAAPVVPDTTKPKVKLTGAKKQKNAKKVVLKAGCNEACTVKATRSGKALLKFKGSKARKVSVRVKAAKAKLAAGEKSKLVLKFQGKKTLALVRKVLARKGSLKIKFSAVATDAAGNKGKATRSVRIRR